MRDHSPVALSTSPFSLQKQNFGKKKLDPANNNSNSSESFDGRRFVDGLAANRFHSGKLSLPARVSV
jgi:hypothetical protein